MSNLGEYIKAMFSAKGFGLLLCVCIFIASSEKRGSDASACCSLSPVLGVDISGIKAVDNRWSATPHIAISTIKINIAMQNLSCLRRLIFLVFTVIFLSPYVLMVLIIHKEIKVMA